MRSRAITARPTSSQLRRPPSRRPRPAPARDPCPNRPLPKHRRPLYGVRLPRRPRQRVGVAFAVGGNPRAKPARQRRRSAPVLGHPVTRSPRPPPPKKKRAGPKALPANPKGIGVTSGRSRTRERIRGHEPKRVPGALRLLLSGRRVGLVAPSQEFFHLSVAQIQSGVVESHAFESRPSVRRRAGCPCTEQSISPPHGVPSDRSHGCGSCRRRSSGSAPCAAAWRGPLRLEGPGAHPA